jgi:hypothetical protein
MKQCKHPCCGDTCRKAKPKPKRKPIRKVSKTRSRENRIYSTKRKKFLSEGDICEFPDCGQPATDCHHSQGRVGKNFLDTKTWKKLCRKHHRIVEENPRLAKKMGLSESRLT